MDSLYSITSPPLYPLSSPVPAFLADICTIQKSPDPHPDPVPEVLPYSRPQRYYETPIQCFNCKEFGHMSNTCRNLNTRYRCVYCGDVGHSTYQCPETVCTTCAELGHHSESCPNDPLTVEQCEVCRGVGHAAGECLARTEAISTEDAKSLRCLSCGQRSHCNCYVLESYSRLVFCAKCGTRGHSGETCSVAIL